MKIWYTLKEREDYMQFDKHETDLYILPETQAERHNIQSFCITKQLYYKWSFSDIEEQSWYGKQFLDIPFRIDLINEIKEKFNITSDIK